MIIHRLVLVPLVPRLTSGTNAGAVTAQVARGSGSAAALLPWGSTPMGTTSQPQASATVPPPSPARHWEGGRGARLQRTNHPGCSPESRDELTRVPAQKRAIPGLRSSRPSFPRARGKRWQPMVRAQTAVSTTPLRLPSLLWQNTPPPAPDQPSVESADDSRPAAVIAPGRSLLGREQHPLCSAQLHRAEQA